MPNPPELNSVKWTGESNPRCQGGSSHRNRQGNRKGAWQAGVHSTGTARSPWHDDMAEKVCDWEERPASMWAAEV